MELQDIEPAVSIGVVVSITITASLEIAERGDLSVEASKTAEPLDAFRPAEN